MKKIISVVSLLSLIFCSLVANPLDGNPLESFLPSFDSGNKNVIIDYEGKSEGRQIPQWVEFVIGGKGYGSGLEDFIPAVKGKQVFIAVGQDDKLSNAYIKSGINLGGQVFATAEKKAGNKLANEDSYTIPGSFSYFLPKIIDGLLDSGKLKSEEQCWLKYNKVDKKGNIIDTYYKSYSVWTLDSKLFDETIEGLLENAEEYFMKLFEKLK